MLKTILIGAALAAAIPAFAVSAAPSTQQNRMATSNKEAVGKKGDERKAFMKQCLSAKAAATPTGGKAR